jgi:hypothetical protein
MGCALSGAPALAAARADFGTAHADAHVRQLADWALAARDAKGLPFAIVDKKGAHIYVFDPQGRLRGHSPVLIGQAPGDDIAPLVGVHAQSGHVPFAERTTPAGRFFSEPGRNMSGEHVVWVDYDSAFAIHRLRPGRQLRERELRLASDTLDDRRASLGCVVVPVRFYENTVERWLGHGRAVIYVMPETKPVDALMDAL